MNQTYSDTGGGGGVGGIGRTRKGAALPAVPSSALATGTYKSKITPNIGNIHQSSSLDLESSQSLYDDSYYDSSCSYYSAAMRSSDTDFIDDMSAIVPPPTRRTKRLPTPMSTASNRSAAGAAVLNKLPKIPNDLTATSGTTVRKKHLPMTTSSYSSSGTVLQQQYNHNNNNINNNNLSSNYYANDDVTGTMLSYDDSDDVDVITPIAAVTTTGFYDYYGSSVGGTANCYSSAGLASTTSDLTYSGSKMSSATAQYTDYYAQNSIAIATPTSTTTANYSNNIDNYNIDLQQQQQQQLLSASSSSYYFNNKNVSPSKLLSNNQLSSTSSAIGISITSTSSTCPTYSFSLGSLATSTSGFGTGSASTAAIVTATTTATQHQSGGGLGGITSITKTLSSIFQTKIVQPTTHQSSSLISNLLHQPSKVPTTPTTPIANPNFQSMLTTTMSLTTSSTATSSSYLMQS